MTMEHAGNIGIADVYRVVTDLQTTMQKVLVHMERVDTRNEFADRMHDDFEARLRVLETADPVQQGVALGTLTGRVGGLEKFRYTLAGGLALLVVVLTALGSYLAAVISARH